MIEVTKISTLIASQYPSLENRFQAQFPTIAFENVHNQLEWSTNEMECKRGLHRLHCFLQQLEKGEDALEEFQMLDTAHREAVLALLLIDSCKGASEAITAFTQNGFAPLKDSVPFFFDTLKRAPEIYPIFSQTSPISQQLILSNLFYLHQRHLQFGEVPLASLSDLMKAITLTDTQILKEKLMLLNLFWTINLMGFDLPKPTEQQKAEEFGPTMSEERFNQLKAIQNCLIRCVEMRSLEPLEDHYLSQLSDFDSFALSNDVKLFFARFSMLLADKKANDPILLKELLNNDLRLIADVAAAEKACYERLKLQAITFLPAIYWKLLELNKEQSPIETMRLFIKFQYALYNALPSLENHLQGNHSIPLFSVTRDEELLRNFINHPNYDFRISLEIGQFLTLGIQLRAPAAEPYPTRSSEAPPSDTATMQPLFRPN